MTAEELADRVLAYANGDGYEYGWDTLAECHDRQYVVDILQECDATTEAQAFRAVATVGCLRLRHERLQDALAAKGKDTAPWRTPYPDDRCGGGGHEDHARAVGHTDYSY